MEIALPKLKGNRQWRMVMNTAHEMEEWKDDGPVHSALLVAAGSSVCILVSEEIDGGNGCGSGNSGENGRGDREREGDSGG